MHILRGAKERLIGVLALLMAAIASPAAADGQGREGESEASPLFAQRAEALLASYHESGRFDGSVIVATRSRVLFEGFAGEASKEFHTPFGRETRMRLASVSKPLTAVLVMTFVESGELRLDQTISEVLPTYPGQSGQKITIEHLLSHSSGIPNYQYKGPYQELQTRALLVGIGSVDVDSLDMIHLFATEPLTFHPGTNYAYSNANYIVLQAIIERLSGKGFEDVLRERLLTPLGMVHTGLADYRDAVDGLADGYSFRAASEEESSMHERALQGQYIGAGAAGSLYSTPQDMVRFAQALFSGQIFSHPETLEGMMRPRRKAYNENSKIALGFYHSTLKTSRGDIAMIGHDGWGPPFTANLQYFPESDLIVFAADNVGGPGGTTYGETVMLTEDLVKLFLDDVIQVPTRPADLVFADLIARHGVEGAVDQFRMLERHPSDEKELNSLGYHYLGRDLVEEAIIVFETNTQLYPDSANAFDSLGEARLAVGDRDGAIDAFREALRIEPKNTAYRTRMDELLNPQ